MRPQLAPLAAALSIAGVMSIGASVATHRHLIHHDRIVAASPEHAVTHAHPAAAPVPRSGDDRIVRPPVAPPSCPVGSPSVHFATPQGAMRYLAAAWNRNDVAALCQVTNPNARFLLNDMHREAVNLRLVKCDKVEVGHYSCTFIHDYPATMHKHGHGRAWLDVAAARNPGWYMTVYEGCG